MGKGKKKANNKKRGGKKTRDDSKDDNDSPHERISPTLQITREQMERARLAASNRTEDPLKNWTRLQNDECPICMLPLPHEAADSNYCVTCSKTICMGCMFSSGLAHTRDGGDAEKAVEKAFTCPFCRSDTTSCDDKYVLDQEMKRANAGNARSMNRVGRYYFDGVKGVQQDKAEGFKWYHRAAEAGSGTAAYNIGACYLNSDGVEQDYDKALEYFQKAAELGYIDALVLIGYLLGKKGDIEEGMLNYRKAAMCGIRCGSSDEWLFDQLRIGFKNGFITKDEYAFTLRENQKAYNEMKSEGREMSKSCNASDE